MHLFCNVITMNYYYTTPLALLLAWTLVQGFTLLLALTTNRSRRKLPPGPSPLPIIGNLHLLGDKPHRSLAKLANFHGPIMGLKLGQITTVIISSSDMAKHVLQKQDLAFSSSMSIPDTVLINNYHMFSVSWLSICPQWRSLRKILNSHIFSVSKLDATQHLRYVRLSCVTVSSENLNNRLKISSLICLIDRYLLIMNDRWYYSIQNLSVI
ncbi:hypothetical protein P3S67_025078 [Capsicum chacoense]